LTFSHDFSQLMQQVKNPIVYVNLFMRHIPHTNPLNIENISTKVMQEFYGQMNTFHTEIDRWKKAKYKIILLGANKERTKKLSSILLHYQIESTSISSIDMIQSGVVSILEGELQAGFELPMDKVAVITEKELFKRQVKKAKRNQKLS